MDEFVIQTVSASEPASTSDSSEINSLQLVPDPEAGRFISVISCCKNNMFLIEVKNSFDGVVYGAGDGALKSRKQNTHRHGLGFQNIVRCADKYLGSTDYTCCDKTFTLVVMLQKS